MVFPLIPLYAQEMGASPSVIGLVVGSFNLLSLFLAIPVGGLTDRWSKKLLLLASVLCNCIYSGALLLAGSVPVLILAQIFGGMGFLLLIVASQAYVSGFRESDQIERGFSGLAFASAVGQALGPAVGGLLLSRTDFGVLFGSALFLAATGVCALVLPAEGAPGGSEQRTPAKLKQMRHFLSDVRMDSILLFTFVIVFAVHLRGSFLPVLLKDKGITEGSIGLLVSVIACSMTLVRLFMSRMLRSLPRTMLLACALACVCAGVALAPLFDASGQLAAVLVLFGLGFGISQPLSMVMVSDIAPEEHSGLAMGLRFTVITSATVLSPLTLGWVASGFGLHACFYAAAGLVAAAGGAIAFLLAGPDKPGFRWSD